MWEFLVASRCIFILIMALSDNINTATMKKLDFKKSHLTSVGATASFTHYAPKHVPILRRPPPGGNRHVRMADGWAPMPPESVQISKCFKRASKTLSSHVKLILSPKQRAKPAASRTRTCTNAAVCIASGECPSRF